MKILARSSVLALAAVASALGVTFVAIAECVVVSGVRPLGPPIHRLRGFEPSHPLRRICASLAAWQTTRRAATLINSLAY